MPPYRPSRSIPHPSRTRGRPRSLTADQEAAIRQLRHDDPDQHGWTDKKLAARFRVSRTKVQSVVRNELWPSEIARMTPASRPAADLPKGMEDRVIRHGPERERYVQRQRARGLRLLTRLDDGEDSLTLPADGTWEWLIFEKFLAWDEGDPQDLLPGFRQVIKARYKSCRGWKVRGLPSWDALLEAYRAIDKESP
jgi:hypothetical protein